MDRRSRRAWRAAALAALLATVPGRGGADEGPGIFRIKPLHMRWDRRDPEVYALWEETRQWSLDHFLKMYDLLDIHFDRWYANSEVEQPGKQVVEELIAKGIAVDERPQNGPVIVRIDELLGLKEEKYRVLVVLRSDDHSAIFHRRPGAGDL